ncbi:hypothetical protein GUJ93_ZPchr0002g23049 [Zizania palustris]|uniref:Uncharacterized protein n=1 Tax=Zizania palustris TaxID=103762 RepID=A0A8J5RH78_ZIZPA|nr:hypothetical protein GUJ93_ZPchr0002g23049 [Zizania palustris]
MISAHRAAVGWSSPPNPCDELLDADEPILVSIRRGDHRLGLRASVHWKNSRMSAAERRPLLPLVSRKRKT